MFPAFLHLYPIFKHILQWVVLHLYPLRNCQALTSIVLLPSSTSEFDYQAMGSSPVKKLVSYLDLKNFLNIKGM